MQHPLVQVRTFLASQAALAAIVGARIYLLQQAQNAAYPNVVLVPVGATFQRQLGGVGHKMFRFSVECRSGQVLQANQMGEIVFGALDGYSGGMGDVTVDRIHHAGETFVFEDQSQVARRIIDFHCSLV